MGKKRRKQPSELRSPKFPFPDLQRGPGAMSPEGLRAAAGERLDELLEKVPHKEFNEKTDPAALSPQDRIAWLTQGERLVLRLFLAGLNAKQVAGRLGKRPQTVKNQLAAIEHKLGVDSRDEILHFVYCLLLSRR